MSDKVKYTPGPWDYEERYDASCGQPCTPDGCHDSHPSGVYEINGPAVGDWPESCSTTSEADARLIAAAPELLDALERMVEHFAMLPPEMDTPGSVMAQARNAIAKAEGTET